MDPVIEVKKEISVNYGYPKLFRIGGGIVSSMDVRSVSRKRAWAWWMALVLVSATALAQNESASEQRQEFWGTSEAPNAKDLPFDTAIPAPINSRVTYTSSQYGSGGVGLRNRGTGGISVSGVITPVKAAYLYWAVITTGTATKPDIQLKIQRLSPPPASPVTAITGTLLGTGPTPCWGGNTISVFRGTVPTSLATGNGAYEVTLLPGAGGTTAGADPWVSAVLPLFEGASLVIVGTGSATVSIYDSGLAAKTFHGNPGLSYSLTLPVAAPGVLTLLDNIGADGQEGKSRTAVAGLADENTEINSVFVAGPRSTFNDSDWNGSSGKPIPQLWDDVGHNITAATPKGTTSLSVTIANEGESTYDCMTTVANVVSEQ
jgi:hypothetical protein